MTLVRSHSRARPRSRQRGRAKRPSRERDSAREWRNVHNRCGEKPIVAKNDF
jgi:hypothetical protein